MKNFYPLLTQAAKGFAGVQVLPLCLMLMLAGNKTDAQVNCNFSLPNGNNNPLTVCVTGLQVSISGVQGLDSLIFYLPNNVSVQSAPAYSQASYTGSNGIHQLKWNAPITDDTVHLTLLPLLCKFFNDNSSININNVSFQCVWWLGGSGAVSTYSTNVTASGTSVSYNLENPNISVITNPVINSITYNSNVGAAGPGGSVATRYTAIKLTGTPVPSPLYYKFTQEGDATHLGLWAVHPDSGDILLSGANTVLNYTFRIDTFIQHHPGYLLGSGSERHILLKQEVLRKCTPLSSNTPVKAQWACAGCNPAPESAVITLNTVINPAGTAAPVAVTYTVSPSGSLCDTSQIYTYRFRIAASVMIYIDSISIPIDTGYFNIHSFYLTNNTDTLYINPNQYSVTTNPGIRYLRLGLAGLASAPPGMTNTAPGLAGTYPYFLSDTLYAVLRIKFNCHAYNGKLQSCQFNPLNPTVLSLANGNFGIRYKTICGLLTGVPATFNNYILNISIQNANTGTVGGYISNTDIDLGLASDMQAGFHYIASDTTANPFALDFLTCDSLRYTAYYVFPAHASIASFNYMYNNTLLFTIDTSYIAKATVGYYTRYTVEYGEALAAYNAANNTAYTPRKAHITFNIHYNGCPFSPDTYGIDTFFVQYRAYCGNCTDCYRSLGCQAVLLFIHCAGTCGNAVTGTKEVSLQRDSFGWTDRQHYLNNQAPLNAAALAAMLSPAAFHNETHKVYPCDSVRLYAQGFTIDTVDIYSLSFQLSYMPPGGLDVSQNIFSFMHGTATLISTDSPDTLHLTLGNPTLSIGYAASFDTLLILNFNILNNQTAGSMLNQHSYTAYMDVWLRTAPPAALAAGAYFIPQVRGEFINTNSEPQNFLTHSCDPWGDLMNLLVVKAETDVMLVPVGHAGSPQIYNIPTPWLMMNACTARTRVGMRLYGGLGINTDDFPFEFRPYAAFGGLPQTSYQGDSLHLVSVHSYGPNVDYTVAGNTIQLPDSLMALEKGDPWLTNSAFAWMLHHRRDCYNTTDTIIHFNMISRAYSDTACRGVITFNNITTPNYTCSGNSIPLVQASAQNEYITLNDTIILSIPFVYYNPTSVPQSPLPNVWFHYTASGTGGPIDVGTATGSGNQVFLHDSLPGYGYFKINSTTYALSSISGEHLKLKIPTPCAEGDTFTVTLRYGALCSDTLFAHYLNGTLLPDSQNVCNVCTRTITIIRAPSAAQLVHQYFTDSCGRIYWHLNVLNNSNAPLYTGTLILRHPLSLPYSAMHSSVTYNGTTQTPLAPASYSYLTWGLFPGDTLPALASNLPSTAADTIAPQDTAFYTLAFDVDCSFVAEQLQAMYAGFGLCENFFNFDTLTAFFFNNYGPDSCCTNSLEAFDFALINHCDTLGWLNIVINDTTYTFTAVLTSTNNDTLYINANLTYDSLNVHYNTLSPGLYFLTIQNNSTFITHTMAVVVDSVDAALCISCPCTPGLNIGEAGDTLYLSHLILNNVLPADSLNGGCISISGLLHIDTNYQLSNLEVKMNPYSTVIIDENIQLLMHDVHVHGCDTMWQSWVASPFVYLNAKRCTIEDGIEALKIEPDALVILDSVRFHANDIGILLNDADANSTDMNYSQHYISNCRFDCTGDYLLPPYAMQTISLCGISSQNHQLDLYDYNEFYDMRNGILAENSDVFATNCRFRNVRHNVTALADQAGYAIKNVNKELHNTTIDGMINSVAAPDTWTMNNCRIGVYTKLSNLVCTGIRMQTVSKGIVLDSCKNAMVKLDNNFIKSRTHGIEIVNSMPFQYCVISNDSIYVNSPNTINTFGTMGGIIVQGNNSITGNGFHIVNNYIELNNSKYGIFISSCVGGVLADNQISMIHPSPIRGIYMANATKFIVSCNSVWGNGADDTQNIPNNLHLPAAYEFRNGPSLYARCNSCYRTYTGISMFGQQNPSHLKANMMDSHHFGLYYGNGSVGQQFLYGNTFKIDTANNRFGAFGVPLLDNFYIINRFRVNPIADALCNPLRIGRANGALVFSNNQANYWASNGWFEENSGINFICSDDSVSCSDDTYRFRDSYDIIHNSSQSIQQIDSSMYEWDAAQYWYNMIGSDSTLLQDTLFATYYASLQGSSGAQFSEVGRLITHAYSITSTDSAQLATLYHLYSTTHTAYRVTDSLIRTNGITENLRQTKDSMRNVMQAVKYELNVLHRGIDSLRSLRMDSIDQINNMLSNSTIFEINQKAVYTIQLRMEKQQELTESEYALLYFISMQCPETGGSSVYAARALYATLNDTIGFDDGYLCANEEWYFRKDETDTKNIQEINLFPNPSNNKIYITGLPKGTVNYIEIINSIGISVIRIISTEPVQSIDISCLPQGVYNARISNANCISTNKFIIYR